MGEDDKTAVLWYLHNGCMVSFYRYTGENDTSNQKQNLGTQSLISTDLSFSKIRVLRIAQPAVPRLAHITKLDLGGNRLEVLPIELWRLTGLQELNVGKNRIKSIPAEITRLTSLRELYVYENCIKELPSQMGRLRMLKVLDVTGNQLTSLPAELLALPLVAVWIDKNAFRADLKWKQKEGPFVPVDLHSIEELSPLLSLRSICLQEIGTRLDDEDREALHHSILSKSMIEQVLIADPDLAPSCSFCGTTLFHPGLLLKRHFDVYNRARVPFLYKACSQPCWDKIRHKRDTSQIHNHTSVPPLSHHHQLS
ncbi:hypothetical protein BX666DRAFT_1989262 [Dichotomocladium elegans]|nr:hypothetical protein BX666DRAFT_1989262 [Dichotomocladium elegans]